MTQQLIPPPTASDGRSPRTPARTRRTRALRLVIGMVGLAIAAPALYAPSASAAAPARYAYQGYAFGTNVSVAGVVKSGNSAPITLGCTTNGNIHKTNSTAAIDLPLVGSTGTVSTTADTYASPLRSRTSATTQGVNLLGGLIKATAVRAVSSVTRSSSGFTTSASGTTLVGLVINDQAISANAAPNTKINLAGLGYVMINEQVKPYPYRLNVNALRVVVNTANTLGVLPGTQVIVSAAVSQLSNPVTGLVGGYAYGTQAQIGTTFDSGPSFVSFMPCLGTNNVLRTNTGAEVIIPGGIASTGTVATTVKSLVSGSSTSAEATATVQNANVLGGIITAGVIKSAARGTYNGSSYSFNDSGSSIANLKILGLPVDVSVPGRVINVPGVGTVTVRKTTRTTKSITNVMVEVRLGTEQGELPIGTVVRIGVSKVALS